MTTPVLSQSHFRGRADHDSIDATPVWIAAEDTNFNFPRGVCFRIRFVVQETAGGNPAAATVKLQSQKNADAFQDVTASSSNVMACDASTTAEDTLIVTKRLGGTGSYIQGRYSEDGSPASTVDMTANSNTEWEFGLIIKSADVAEGNTITLKVVAVSGTAITATLSPVITVASTAVSTRTSDLIELISPAPTRSKISAGALAVTQDLAFARVPVVASLPIGVSDASEAAFIAQGVVYSPTAMGLRPHVMVTGQPDWTPELPRPTRSGRPARAGDETFLTEPPAPAIAPSGFDLAPALPSRPSGPRPANEVATSLAPPPPPEAALGAADASETVIIHEGPVYSPTAMGLGPPQGVAVSGLAYAEEQPQKTRSRTFVDFSMAEGPLAPVEAFGCFDTYSTLVIESRFVYYPTAEGMPPPAEEQTPVLNISPQDQPRRRDERTRQLDNQAPVAVPLVTRQIVAESGSYALTGAAAALLHGWKTAAAADAYALTGTAAALLHQWRVTAGTGTYALTGIDAALRQGRRISAEAGNYALTGTGSSLLHQWSLTAGVGSYAMSGADAALIAGDNKVLPADVGSYTVTGTAAAPVHDQRLTGNTGGYALSGTDATLIRNLPLVAGTGSYMLNGAPATLSRAGMLLAGAGAYSLSGVGAALLAERRLAGETGSFALAGTDAVLTVAQGIIAGEGIYSLVGADAALRATWRISAESGAYLWTGVNVALTLTGAPSIFLPSPVAIAAQATMRRPGRLLGRVNPNASTREPIALQRGELSTFGYLAARRRRR